MQAHGKRCRFLQTLAALAFAGVAMITDAIGSSYSTNVTDIWYNPSQPGKGVQLIQTDWFVFVTVYIYGPDGKPTWVTGELEPSASATWTGPLYVNTGPYFGGPFNPAAVTQRQAGTMTLALQSTTTGSLTYSVDGVRVSESLQRQPLTLDDYNGSYVSVATETITGCINPAENGTSTAALVVHITQSGQSMKMQLVNLDDSSCTIVGTYSQLGLNGTLVGPYSCSTGQSGNAQVFEMRNSVNQFNARIYFAGAKSGCSALGRITGVVAE